MSMAVGLPQFHSDNHWIKWERRWSAMKPNNPQLAEMFSDYVKTRKYVDSGWKSIAGNILAFIKNEPFYSREALEKLLAESFNPFDYRPKIIQKFFSICFMLIICHIIFYRNIFFIRNP